MRCCPKKMQQLELAGASAVPNLSHDEWLDTLKEPGFMSELWPAQHLLGHSGVLRGASDAAACAPRVKGCRFVALMSTCALRPRVSAVNAGVDVLPGVGGVPGFRSLGYVECHARVAQRALRLALWSQPM